MASHSLCFRRHRCGLALAALLTTYQRLSSAPGFLRCPGKAFGLDSAQGAKNGSPDAELKRVYGMVKGVDVMVSTINLYNS